jgi:hypothetical protein
LAPKFGGECAAPATYIITEIIIKLHHQRFRIFETPIPTYYGDEICRVNGMKYARNVLRAVRRYKNTCRSNGNVPNILAAGGIPLISSIRVALPSEAIFYTRRC